MIAISIHTWPQSRLRGVQKGASLPLNFHSDTEKAWLIRIIYKAFLPAMGF